MHKNKKEIKNKGITLIALVITIIVLLILAGVSIAMLTGENRNTYTSKWCKSYNRIFSSKRSCSIKEKWDRNI